MNDNKEKTIDKTFLLRIDPELKKEAAVKAKEANRSLNGHIVNVIKEDLKK